MPKVDIHCHLMGTIRKETMEQLAAKNSADVSQEEVESYYIRGEKPVGVLHILRQLEREILKTPDDLRRITYEYLEDCAKHNVRHTEFFYNFTGLMNHTDNSYGELQAGLLTGIADARTDFGISSHLIPAIDREADPQFAVQLVENIIQNRDDDVLGIGIDYSEIKYPPELFHDAYKLAREAGLKTTAHAGEFGTPWTNVQTALDDLQVDRLDHAYTILDNPELTQRCIDERMVITVVPTNSYYLRTLAPEEWAQKHPIRSMGKAGLLIHPNTDDPTFHLTDPTNVWVSMVEHFGYDMADLRTFMLNGIEGSWVDQSTKDEWAKNWAAEFDQLRGQEFTA